MNQNIKNALWIMGSVAVTLIAYNYAIAPLMTKAGIKPIA